MRDLIGKEIKGFKILGAGSPAKDGRSRLLCECTGCGEKQSIRERDLLHRKHPKCKRCITEYDKKQSFRRAEHKLHHVWKNMRKRCNNPKTSNYKNYGGRGIKVCKRWDDFLLFLEDMEDSYREGLTLDRVDNEGDYTPENCKWSTVKEQNKNKRSNVLYEYKGEEYIESELASKFNIHKNTFRSRRLSGWSLEQIINGKK